MFLVPQSHQLIAGFANVIGVENVAPKTATIKHLQNVLTDGTLQ